MSRLLSALVRLLGTLSLLLVLFAGGGLLFAGTWLADEDVPAIADAIVVMGGHYSRPMYAADLYRRGYAETIFVPRVEETENDRIRNKYGFTIPRQEVVYHRILTDGDVPPAVIRMYGHDMRSTLEEVETLAGKLGRGPGRLIVVTSPYHLQRTRMIFEDILSGWTVMVCATPYDPLPDPWWKDQKAARNVVLETAKIVYYMFGGAFRSTDNDGGNVQ